MYSPVSCPWLVAFDGSFRLAERSTAPPPGAPDKETLKEQRARRTDALRILQRRLYAENLHSILLVFQCFCTSSFLVASSSSSCFTLSALESNASGFF